MGHRREGSRTAARGALGPLRRARRHGRHVDRSAPRRRARRHRRIETLFVARGARAWDHTGAGEPGAGDRELVNDAVTDALRNGGSVEPYDLASLASPGGEVPTMAALLRTGRA